MVSYGSSLALWVYLADWILALILGLAFVFWFPRLVGFVITQLLRLLVWRRYKIRISLDAFRISPLGGRITARNIIISNNDHTVSILRVNLTWRYWLFRPTRILEYFLPRDGGLANEHEGISSDQNTKLASSLQLLLEGLEVFMYNRSWAYENIVEKLDKEMPGMKDTLNGQFELTSSSATHGSQKESTQESSEPVSSSSEKSSKNDTNAVGFLLHMLPISVRIKKGAYVVGNPTTPTILVASFKSAIGLIDYHTAASSFDRYRTVYDLNMEKFQISLKPNITYDPLRYSSEAFANRGGVKARPLISLRRFRNAFKKLLLRRLLNKKDMDLNEEWRGLRRYIDDFQDERLMNLATIEEYAKYSVILDSVSTQMIYFYDIPGITTPESLQKNPPKFGVDLIVSMATFHYGPWADRQRGPIHALLFPALCRDSSPSPSREPFGSPRSYDGFDFNIIVKDEFIIRTPTRELSKDREELAHAATEKGNKITRPFGWLEIKLAKTSRFTSFNSYKATENGWPNKMTCYFSKPEMRSSVNHDVFFVADEHTIDCDLSFPLKWNGETVWTFNNLSKNAQLFFLRDHAFLFTDLLSDFASGTPAPYEQFRPFQYNFNWNIKDYRLHFNVNDHNIINSALDFNNNKYICFHGGNLEISSVIPLLGNFAKSTTIDFKIFTDSLSLALEVPPWHTASSYLKGSNKMGHADNFEVTGSYTYYRGIEINYSSFAVMNAIGDNITLLFFGYFIRYLFTFRENYMGDFKHFKTFEEYTHGANLGFQDDSEASLRSMASNEGTVKEKEEEADPLYWNELKTENDLNVQFTFKARNGLILLPCNLYDHTSNVGLTFDYLDVDIHLCHFYMDLQADFSPVTGYYFTRDSPGNYHGIIYDIDEYKRIGEEKGSDIIIDNFQVHTHRMLGLLPSLLTYHCKWDFSCASFIFDTHPSCLAGIKLFFGNFITGFKDLENTFIYEIPLVFDMANFTFRCDELVLKLDTGVPNTALKVKIDDTLIAFTDRANERYSSKICVSMPKITVQMIDSGADAKHHFYLETSLMFTDICLKAWPNDFRRSQQAWARRNDAPTHRIPFLVDEETKDSVYDDAYGCFPTSVSLPDASVPLTDNFYFVRENRGYDDDLPSVNSTEESFCGLESNEKFDPTTNYHSEDFRPNMEQEPGHKTDAFILELDTINGFLSPLVVSAFLGLAQGFRIDDIEMLLDVLQAKTVKDIKMFISPLSMCDNVRFVAPEINMRITQQPMVSPENVLCSTPTVPIITINIQEPSVALTKLTTRTKGSQTVLEEEPMALALHVKHVHCFIHDPHYFSPAATFLIEDIEAWMAKDSKVGLTSSVQFQEIKMTLFQDDIPWLFSFATDIASEFEKAMQRVPKNENPATLQKLIYLIGNVAKTNGVEHDPTVLTKPSSILRSCDDHVRFHEGWKLVAKFRSMVDRLPSEQYKSLTAKLKDPDWQIPDMAKEEVSSAFGLWRSWEQVEAQRTIFLDHIFGCEKKEPDLPSKMHFETTSFELELLEPQGLRDYFLAQSAKIIVHLLTSPDGQPTSVLFFDFDVLDGILSTICVETLSAVMKVVKDKPKKTTTDIEDEYQEIDNSMVRVSTAISKSTRSENKSHLFLFTSIKLCHLKIQLPHTFAEFSTYDNFNGLQKIGNSFCLASSAKEYSLCFGRGDLNHLDFTFTNSYLLIANFGSSKNKIHQLDFKLGDCDIKALDSDGELINTARTLLEHDVPFLKLRLVSSEKSPEVEETSIKPFSLGHVPDFHANFEIGHITFDIQVLCPLIIQFTTLRSKTSIRHQNSSLSFLAEYQKFLFDLMMNDFPLLRFEDTHLLTSQRVTQVGDSWAVDSNLNIGFLKITNLNILNSLHEVLKNLENINKRIVDLKLLSPPKKDSQDTPKQSPKLDPFDKIALRAYVKQENMSISTFKEQCRYTLELDGLSFSASNIHKATSGFVSKCLMFGGLSLPVMRISVLDPSIPVGLSTMLDINLAAKILNDNPEDAASEPTRSLQIESEHSRICLSPAVLFKLVDITDLVTRIYGSYDINLSQAPTEPAEQAQESQAPETKESPIKFSSVHVLFYNLCIGWLFGSSHKDYPGVILGAERIFAVTKHGLGKLSLMEGYLSAANGNTSSSFYSILSELNSLNRAFMPKLQFNYCIIDGKSLWVDLKGDELDVRFMSNSLVMLERTVKSGSEVQEFFKSRSRTMQRRKSYKDQFPQKAKKKPATPFKPPFSSVQTNISFAGSRVLFYRLQEENLQDDPPSLSLQSPSVNLAVYYKHLRQNVKSHNLKFEILMKLSDNTVYSSCVPVIMDFIEASKLMLRNSKEDSPELEDFGENIDPQPCDTGSNIGGILQDLDFHVGIIIEKQRLSLSCEPTAKVAAIVEFEGASILAANNIKNSSAIDAMARLDSMSASLQHIYSDQRSGYIGVKSIMVSNCITFDDTVNIVSTGSISEVTAYVKMKQYHDVDLFRDIWYPRRYQNNRRQLSPKLNPKRSQSKMKEVSSTYAIPLSLTFILSNLALEVDFGVALGVMMLDVNKGWIVSRKTSDWFYDMNFGLQELRVGSRGRLGGYVLLEKFNAHSSIEWKSRALPLLDVPLIKFSGGFENLTLKLAFDEHLFAVGNLEKWRIEVYNRKNGENILKDHLYVIIQYHTTEVFLTSLAASDLHDIFSTMSRMMDEKRTSYREILNDSNKENLRRQDDVPMNKLLEVVKKLETNIEVRTGSTAIQVYPQTFDDSRVLYIKLDKSTASFFQNEYSLGVSNEIELKFNNLTTSLSTATGITKEKVEAFTVPEFASYARKAKGGTIFLSPKFMISMRTFQAYNSNVIEYLFQSSFGGTVDVRWNLGSVNCVREMYAAHRRAFASRTEYSTSKVGALRDTNDIEKTVLGADVPDNDEGVGDDFDAEEARKDIDRDINETFEKVAKDSKFSYVPLAPPIIEAPRLKELGNATPPLEWFGLHRDKFPDATHQLAIVTLQKLIHEIDDHYSKALGTA